VKGESGRPGSIQRQHCPGKGKRERLESTAVAGRGFCQADVGGACGSYQHWLNGTVGATGGGNNNGNNSKAHDSASHKFGGGAGRLPGNVYRKRPFPAKWECWECG
jgi:hypothetical protein